MERSCPFASLGADTVRSAVSLRMSVCTGERQRTVDAGAEIQPMPLLSEAEADCFPPGLGIPDVILAKLKIYPRNEAEGRPAGQRKQGADPVSGSLPAFCMDLCESSICRPRRKSRRPGCIAQRKSDRTRNGQRTETAALNGNGIGQFAVFSRLSAECVQSGAEQRPETRVRSTSTICSRDSAGMNSKRLW